MGMLFSRTLTVPLAIVVFAIAVFPRTTEHGKEVALLVAVGLMLSATAAVLSKYFGRTRSFSAAGLPASSSARATAASDARDLARMDSDLG